MQDSKFNFLANPHIWKSFFLKTPQERNTLLHYCPPESALYNSAKIENFSTIFGLPQAFSIYAKINGSEYCVPMALEESSVVAASCKSNKLILQHANGFVCTSLSEPFSLGEGRIYAEFPDGSALAEFSKWILHSQSQLVQTCNEFAPALANRSGGVVHIGLDQNISVDTAAILVLKFNVGNLMGANTINHVLEQFSRSIEGKFGCFPLFKIVSNYHPPDRVVESKFSLPVQVLGWNDVDGLSIAKRIVKLNDWAMVGTSRAATHNKGIFNAIDSIAIATGQDWRAIEAAGHAYASRLEIDNDGSSDTKPKTYGPLTRYTLTKNNTMLEGSIRLPIPVGISGYGIQANELASYNIQWMGLESAEELAFVMASIGLSCNFSALRAIATDGIQSGHMKLHLMANKKK